ncbi:putative oxidoreductase CipA [Lophiotrema nucula]|uniref:Putative oxidoreductase CipA n=1 Tax=Lophiotrema nucula TaxID=690887 RepID=A0A6A5Z2S9_9PLEO|nr:putative oxidoreductase CipA [Lophiotrema nucula]
MAQQFANQQASGFSNHIKNVAIVGAGGQSGKYMVAELLKKGTFNITAITRADSTNKPAEGVNVAVVDYDNPSTIVTALKGQDAFIITMPARAAPDTQKVLLKAAADAGVPWVLPNEFGNDGTDLSVRRDIPTGIPKEEARNLIQSFGVSKWIGIVTGFWYEYSVAAPGLLGVKVRQKEMLFYDEGTVRLSVSTFPQVGRAVAALLSLPILPENEGDERTTLSGYANRFVFVSSFAVSQKDIFASLKRVTGTTDADYRISSMPATEQYAIQKEKLRSGDPIAYGHMMYSRYFYGDEPGFFEGTSGLDNERLGLEKEDLDEWTRVGVQWSEEMYVEKLYNLA